MAVCYGYSVVCWKIDSIILSLLVFFSALNDTCYVIKKIKKIKNLEEAGGSNISELASGNGIREGVPETGFRGVPARLPESFQSLRHQRQQLFLRGFRAPRNPSRSL